MPLLLSVVFTLVERTRLRSVKISYETLIDSKRKPKDIWAR